MLMAQLLLGSACARRDAGAGEHSNVQQWPVLAAGEGKALLAKYECHRCHQGTGLKAPPVAKDCAGCHQRIAEGRFEAPSAMAWQPEPEVMAQWQKHTRHLIHVPDLRGAASRLRRVWLAGFLQNPHDLRPSLEETMPRLSISSQVARKLATHLAAEDPTESVQLGFRERGRRILDEKGCGCCHQFSGVPSLAAGLPPKGLSPAELQAAKALAPELRFSRDRMHPSILLKWVRDPASVQKGALMPTQGLSEQDARHVVAYLVSAPLQPIRPPSLPDLLPLLQRRVSFDEVSERVFRGSCWHCHSDPDYAFGDGGPGNTGGFGFKGKGIELATYEGVLSGYLDAQRERRSLVEPENHQVPRLIRSLLARRDEEVGVVQKGILGMPLGLPPLSPEQLQLVRTWVQQGAPR